MGGIGSGRYWSCKATTQDYLAIDIRKWHREQLLVPNKEFTYRWTRSGEQTASIHVNVFEYKVILSYRVQEYETCKGYNYAIPIYWTPCEYGGRRPWFLCPSIGCGRRVAILYAGAIYACRHCYKLAYKCQSESAFDRAMRHGNKIREKLDWEPGILDGTSFKPKGMHWSTFERLCAQYHKFENFTLMHIQEKYTPMDA